MLLLDMPVPGTNISQENILGMLFKKNEHVVNTNPTGPFTTEPLTNARPRIFPTEQLIAQAIPKNDINLKRNLVQDTTFSQKTQGGASINLNAKRYTNPAYPYIAYYEKILLMHKVQGVSYFYSSNGTTTFVEEQNILTDTIPITYDTHGTFDIKIYFLNGTTFHEIAPNDDMYPWLLDTDGGIVTFYCNGTTCVTYPVYISFWRYEGAKGLVAASTSNKLEPSVIIPNRTNFTFSKEIAINNSAGNPDTITTAFAKMDDWLFTNMISQPPAPTKIGEYRKTTEIGVIFSGPTQIYLLDMHVPVIKYINSDIIITSSTPSQTISPSPLVKNTTFIPSTTNKVNGIVISKLAGTSGIETRETTTNGIRTTYRVYVYYNPALASNPTFTLEIWYANDSSYLPNKLSVPGLSFLTAYPPSAPTVNTPQPQSTSQITISWTEPQFVMYNPPDTLEQTASTQDPTIQNYLVTYTPSYTTRYPGLVNTTANIFTSTSTTPPPLISLLPGTTYTINVKARNTANTAYGQASANVTGATDLPDPPPTLLLMSNPFTTSLTNGTIAQVGNTVAVTPPIFIEDQAPLSSLYYPLPVHIQTNTGSQSTGITTLELSNNIKSISATIDGFPAKSYTDSSSQELEITSIQTYDWYGRNIASLASSTGFYLSAEAKFKLKNLPNASSTQQTVTIKAGATPYSHRYYVEKAQAGQPSLIFPLISLPPRKLISGIPTIGSYAANKTITCYIDASNIGTYFYRRSGIFDIYGTSYINPFTQDYLPPSVTPPITASVPFTVPLPLNITPTDYARGFTMKARAHNGVISGQEQNVPVPLLIDSASYNASFPTTPPDPTNGFVTGMRCVTAAPDVEPVPGTLEPTNTTYYDISNILTSLDLPYLHGKYQVRDSHENTNTDFVDYGVYGGSNLMHLDLSPLQSESGFRWVTYAWKVPHDKDVIDIKFKLKDFFNNARLVKHPDNNTISIQNNTTPIIYSSNTDFKAFYRILSTNLKQNTIWMDINKTDQNGNLTYYMDYNKVSLNGIYGGLHRDTVIPNINTVGDLIYKVISRIFTTTIIDDVYILIRLGIRMNFYGINFSDIQCSVS